MPTDPALPGPTGPTGGAREPADRPSLPELVLDAARDLTRLDTAFDAELLLSALLGGVYAGTAPDRGEALAAFAREFDAHLADAGTDPARLARAVLAALTGEDADTSDTAGDPAWLGQLGAVQVTGGWACGDRYGDQTSYVVTYGYRDGTSGGPEHAILVLVDHNLGMVKDLVVAAPAGAVLDSLRDSVLSDPDAMTWLAEVDPATVRAAATGYLRATDNSPELPDSPGLPENRVLVAARLATLPLMDPAPPAGGSGAGSAVGSATDERSALVAQFLQSPEARLSGLAGAGGARGEAVGYGLNLIADFAQTRGGDPLRWSPRAVEVFLMDWIHGRAVLDDNDARTLPDALGAWVLWSGRLIGLPDASVQATFDQVGTARDEFVRLCATGERQSPAVRAMRRLIADAVDLTDDTAVDAWLRAHESDA